MNNLKRIKYYFKRIKEASLISVVMILKIRIKKSFFLFFYFPMIYNKFNRPRVKNGYFVEAYKFGNVFKKSFYENKTVFNDVLFDVDLYKEINDNSFPCLGYGLGKIPSGLEWNRDQFHNKDWDIKYFNKIDFVSINTYCDVKVPWEYSRLQFLMILALKFINNPRENLNILVKYEKIVLNWIASNPVGYGVNWICNMEVSIRVANLSLSLLLLKDNISDDLRNKIEISILEHHKYIKNFPELSDVPGNHYLSNLMGLYITNFMIFGKLHKKTKSVLVKFSKEAKEQFLEGGCHFEMAPIYHRLCMDMVGIVLALSSESGEREEEFHSDLLDVYKNGVDFCNAVSSNNRLPMFGDFDNGHVIWLGNDARDSEYLSQFYSVIKNGSFHGKNNYQTLFFSTLANLKLRKSDKNEKGFIKTFEKSGFLSARNQSLVGVVRVGPQGLKGRASHDHDDALNLWLSNKGVDILVDEGCNSYSLDKEIRKKCIMSSAHNVVKIFEKERFDPVLGSIVNTVKGASVSSSYSHGEIDEVCYLESSLNTEKDIDFKFSMRKVEIKKQENRAICTVYDNWELEHEQSVETRWRINTDTKPSIELNNVKHIRVLCCIEGQEVLVEIKSPSKIKLDIFEFDYSSTYGYADKRFGLHLIYLEAIKSNATTKFYVDEK